MECCQTQSISCGCGVNCCDGEVGLPQNWNDRKLVIDFLYLDLDTCSRCQETDSSLDEAIKDVIKIVELTGVEIVYNKVHIDSIEKAVKYSFISSPTIRVNKRDIQLEVKESKCESCGDICGEEVDCRVWIYNNNEYNAPPKSMIIEALLRSVYSSPQFEKEDEEYKLPDNLKKFFSALDKK